MLVLPVDAFGNEVFRASLRPRITVSAAATGVGGVAGSDAASPSCLSPPAAKPPPIDGHGIALPEITYEITQSQQQGGGSKGGVDSHGSHGVSLRLCLTGAPALVCLTLEDEDEDLGAAVVEVHLTGCVHALHASVQSCGAVHGQLYGPVRVLAVDRDGNAVGNAIFAPNVRAERRGGAAGERASEGSVSCVVEELHWRKEVIGSPDVALLWLRITGDPGEIVLVVEDRGGMVRRTAESMERCGGTTAVCHALCSTHVPLYMTGPPYFLRASWPSDEEVTAGEEVRAR